MPKKEPAKQQNVVPPKFIDDLWASFANMEKWHEDDPEWDEIRKPHGQLISLETRRKNVAENSIDRFIRTLKLAWIDQQVINQPTLIWLLEDCANKNLGKIPIYQPFAIENGVFKESITDDQMMGFLIWMNLLETGDPNSPIPIADMEDIIRGRNTHYETLDRKTAMLKAWAIDEAGNVKIEAIELSARDWSIRKS